MLTETRDNPYSFQIMVSGEFGTIKDALKAIDAYKLKWPPEAYSTQLSLKYSGQGAIVSGHRFNTAD